jgi:hypothetical protein
MKRLTLFAILVIVIVFCFCKWVLAPQEPPVTGKRAPQIAPSRLLAREAQATAPPPASAVVARADSAQPLTDDRRRIFDSPDIIGTINRVHASGTDDEKQWALYLLASCVQINWQASQQPPHVDNAEQEPSSTSPTPTPTSAALAKLKKQAFEALAIRCAGVKQLSLEDRRSLQADLRAAAIANQSVLGQLRALAMSQESRWSSEQAGQITNSLYSGDPVLAESAFFALVGAMDSDSPGGLDRNLALNKALGPIYAEAPLSDFERLGVCAVLGRCGSAWDTDYPVPPPNAEVTRLAEKYRAAVESRMDARSIMAIR